MKELAVILTGGKQYPVSVGDTLAIEKMIPEKGFYKEGDVVSFDKVLLYDNGKDTLIGEPYLKGASVKAKILEIGKGDKVMVVKYKAKSRYLKTRGHRQPYFKVEITRLSK